MFQQSTPSRIAFLGLVCGVAAFPSKNSAQAYTPPPPPLTTAPCKPTKKDPCTAPNVPAPTQAPDDKFAFPGEAKDTGTLPLPSAPDDSSGAPAPPSGAPGAPAGTASKTAPADPSFPFPGEPAETKSSGSSSSSSASSPDAAKPDDAASSASPLRDEGSSGSTVASRRRKLAKVEDPDAREDKDLEVSRFYISSGNFIGAYNRAKDAVRLYPDDAEAHYVLAAAAQKLKKNEEAMAEYTAYLKLDPDGDHVKVARHALTEIH